MADRSIAEAVGRMVMNGRKDDDVQGEPVYMLLEIAESGYCREAWGFAAEIDALDKAREVLELEAKSVHGTQDGIARVRETWDATRQKLSKGREVRCALDTKLQLKVGTRTPAKTRHILPADAV